MADNLFTNRNPFNRPRPKKTGRKKIKTYNNPFAKGKKDNKKNRRDSHTGLRMGDIINSKEDSISLRDSHYDSMNSDRRRGRNVEPIGRINTERGNLNRDGFGSGNDRESQNGFNTERGGRTYNDERNGPKTDRGRLNPAERMKKKENVESRQVEYLGKPSNLAKNLFGDNPMAQIGMDYTKGLVENSVGKIDTDGWARKLFNSPLKKYFEVDNSYLLKKVKHIIFPFLVKIKSSANSQIESMHIEEPVELESNPVFVSDLYIPIMSFITYVLLSCLSLGLNKKNTSNCALLTVFETIILKVGIIVANNHSVGYIDILALSGYRYLGMCFIVIAHIFNSISLVRYLVYPLQFYICGATFFNTYNTLKYLSTRINPQSAVTAINQDPKKLRVISLGLSAVQVVFTWILLYISF